MAFSRQGPWLVTISRSVVAACTMLIAGGARSEETKSPFDWGLSERIRFESKQDFNFDDSSQSYMLAQTRLHLGYKSESSGKGFIQLQDSRVFGENSDGVPTVNPGVTPNAYEDHLDIHLAHWTWKLGGADLKVGRQKLNLADQRLVASLEWANTARVHDGVRVTMGNAETRQMDVFLTRLVPVDPYDFNDWSSSGSRYMDSRFHGVFVQDRETLSKGQLEYWYFYRRNHRFLDRTSTIGVRYTNDNVDWQPDLQVSYQLGRFDGDDHSAWMIHVGVTHVRDADTFKASYSYGSGDSDPSDDDHNTFDNLYPLNHAYYGYMDFFALQNLHNLAASYTRQLSGVQLQASWNSFWLAEEKTDAWYGAGLAPLRPADANAKAYVGNELDITIRTTLLSGRVALYAGASRFFGGSYLQAVDLKKDPHFFFVSATYTLN